MFRKKLSVGGQHVLFQSLGVTCAGGHACGELITLPSKFTSVLRSFLISSSTVHHSCSVVGELIGVKNFHQVLCATDRQFCCVSFCLLPFVCRDTKPAYHGILLVLVEALESFWGRWSVAAHPIQGLAVCSNLFLMLALLMHCKVYRTGSRAFRYVEPDKHFC